ncbi:MAG: hypothetical protein CMH91_04735 [Oceanicaulis sp.]|uniref:hypothetical protein n=1 Tax=unclassified Oceanicaulis TaxID=2632123 RepID=UPI000C46A82F|nr:MULTISPECIES: hypothetical protein [unclassified Oceanicaulis]MAB68398.1 hypothetical protein [Oceanicaulis sp.]MBC38358.1 hypothetical protein [Oceanicaulis sp.]MBG35554.1 hypothetical protein [Oceanicaulis sp.]HBU60917.1 hypothetical protein [Oceanicaulis sp.]|tara:strand:+ start:1112 stop:1882 length:771 start_codon:yes stop_codon:yes gene_type:complete
MLRTLTLGACAALCSSAALAQLPDPLERALSVSLNDPVAQRVDVMVGDNDGQITVRIQEDADGASHYTLLSPSEAGLNESEREMWEEMFLSDEDASEEDEEDGFGGEDFDAEDLRRIIGSEATLLREEDGLLIYGFTPQAFPDDEDEPDGAARRMLDAMTGEVSVNAQTGHVAGFQMILRESVKPNFAARIEDFRFVQSYVFDEVVNGPRLESLRFNIAGSAAFQSFDESMSVDILDVQWATPSAGGAVVDAAESH